MSGEQTHLEDVDEDLYELYALLEGANTDIVEVRERIEVKTDDADLEVLDWLKTANENVVKARRRIKEERGRREGGDGE